MSPLLVTSLLVLSVAVELNQGSSGGVESVDCPPWALLNTTTNRCMCGSDLYGIVQCNSETLDVSVQNCYCMTYSGALNKTLLNYCYYTCHLNRPLEHYLVNASNVSGLNDAICRRFNRTGFMCGECIAGHAPPVYSYSTACVECTDYKYNWLKYIAVAYLPLTVFYIVVVLLKISVNSAPLVVYVTISQVVSAPSLIRRDANHLYKNSYNNVFLAPHEIWNLNFLRGVYDPFCLHPDLSLLQLTCLDYIVGLYPLVLIFITYCLVRLHDRYVVISKLWKPVYKLFYLLRKEWNIRESLVSVFATFLVLSYVKTLNVSVDILAFNRAAFNISGSNADLYYLIVNGSLSYFSHEHIPYAVFSIFMMIIFNILPLVLLCVYPCSCFQKCLNLTGCHSHLLHIFMDTFQGCFRERPRDCRYFAGFYVFLRVVNMVILSVFISPLYSSVIPFLFISVVIMLAICQPYKNDRRNMIDIALISWFVLFVGALNFRIEALYIRPFSTNATNESFLGLFFIFLPAYGLFLILYRAILFSCKVCGWQHWIRRRREEPLPEITSSRDEVLPLIN